MTTMRTLMWSAALLACTTRGFAQAPDALPRVMPLPQTSTAVPAPLPVAVPTTVPMPVPPALVFRPADEAADNALAKGAAQPPPPADRKAGQAPVRKKAVKQESTRQKSANNVPPKKPPPKKKAPRKASPGKATKKKSSQSSSADANHAPNPMPAAGQKTAG